MSVEQAGPGFERDIRPLFRQEDVDAMSFAFDLASYEDVQTNAGTSTSGSRTAACPATPAGRSSRSSDFVRGSTRDRLRKRCRVNQGRIVTGCLK